MRRTFDDEARIGALRDYRVLDTAPEPGLDNITQLVCELLGVPIALVSLVDEKRQWFKSKCGLDADETAREISFCTHAIRDDWPLVIEDAHDDPRFVDNPLVTGPPHIRFYAGAVLRTPDGHALGTLCAIDRQPRSLDEEQLELLVTLAHQVALELELRRRVAILDEELEEQKERQKEKEVLASMVVHDLRAPLSAMMMSGSFLQRRGAFRSGDDRVLLDEMMASAARMKRMLMDILDICLADTGKLQPRFDNVSLGDLARAAAKEMQPLGAVHDIGVVADCELDDDVAYVDSELVRRVITNLIDNGIKFAPEGTDVTTRLWGDADTARITVTNQGAPRGTAPARSANDRASRGLGLAFCELAVGLHGGKLAFDSPPTGGAVVSVTLPRRPG